MISPPFDSVSLAVFIGYRVIPFLVRKRFKKGRLGKHKHWNRANLGQTKRKESARMIHIEREERRQPRQRIDGPASDPYGFGEQVPSRNQAESERGDCLALSAHSANERHKV